MSSIEIDDLTTAIADELRRYVNVVESDLIEAAKNIARDGVKELKATSPKLTEDYRKGWRMTKVTATKLVMHNATDYQLTHLLEKGHAMVGGGRVQAYPHISQVERKVVQKFISETERLIANANG